MDTNQNHARNWLQLYVDAVMERDPYKRLALVRELKNLPRTDAPDEEIEEPRPAPRKIQPRKIVRRRQ